MENKKLLMYGGGGLAAVALLLLFMRSKDGASIVQGGTTALGDSAALPGFNSNINVEVNPNAFNGLAQQFMPLFGFVGIGIVDTGQPYSQTTNVNIINPPTQVAAPVVRATQPKPPKPPVLQVARGRDPVRTQPVQVTDRPHNDWMGWYDSIPTSWNFNRANPAVNTGLLYNSGVSNSLLFNRF